MIRHWTCTVCGASIVERTCRVRKFCSRKCAGDHKADVREADKSPLRSEHARNMVVWMANARARSVA